MLTRSKQTRWNAKENWSLHFYFYFYFKDNIIRISYMNVEKYDAHCYHIINERKKHNTEGGGGGWGPCNNLLTGVQSKYRARPISCYFFLFFTFSCIKNRYRQINGWAFTWWDTFQPRWHSGKGVGVSTPTYMKYPDLLSEMQKENNKFPAHLKQAMIKKSKPSNRWSCYSQLTRKQNNNYKANKEGFTTTCCWGGGGGHQGTVSS